MQSWAAGRNHKLDVYGPPGVEQVVAGFEQAYSLDTGYRVQHHGEEWMPRATAGAVAQPDSIKSNVQAALVHEHNGQKMTAFNLEHDMPNSASGYLSLNFC